MLVRQLVGRYAGHIVEMPYHVGRRCIDAGTAELPHVLREVPVPPAVPDGWRDLHHFKQIKLARELSGRDVKSKAEAYQILAEMEA